MTYSEKAEQLLHEWVQSEQLRKHCYAVAASMRSFARTEGADPDLWGAVGLLHDMDFERYPNMPDKGEDLSGLSAGILAGEAEPPPLHTFVSVDYLRKNGWSQEICRAILSHADYSGVPPVSPMEKTLCAVDELSSFVIAVALVKPTKSVFDVDVSSVKKKMKDKAFARAVSREDIVHGAERLGVELDLLIERVIQALREDAAKLGVAGVAQ